MAGDGVAAGLLGGLQYDRFGLFADSGDLGRDALIDHLDADLRQAAGILIEQDVADQTPSTVEEMVQNDGVYWPNAW